MQVVNEFKYHICINNLICDVMGKILDTNEQEFHMTDKLKRKHKGYLRGTCCKQYLSDYCKHTELACFVSNYTSLEFIIGLN